MMQQAFEGAAKTSLAAAIRADTPYATILKELKREYRAALSGIDLVSWVHANVKQTENQKFSAYHQRWKCAWVALEAYSQVPLPSDEDKIFALYSHASAVLRTHLGIKFPIVEYKDDPFRLTVNCTLQSFLTECEAFDSTIIRAPPKPQNNQKFDNSGADKFKKSSNNNNGNFKNRNGGQQQSAPQQQQSAKPPQQQERAHQQPKDAAKRTSGGGQNSDAQLCTFCAYKGHVEADCFWKKDGNARGSRPPQREHPHTRGVRGGKNNGTKVRNTYEDEDVDEDDDVSSGLGRLDGSARRVERAGFRQRGGRREAPRRV
jgi:hypothetical protein